MNVAFVTSYLKTEVLHEIALRLESAGHKAFWISPNLTWADWLKARGWANDRFLTVDHLASRWKTPGEPTREQIAFLEGLEKVKGPTASPKIHDLILMDRLLREKPASYAYKHLAVCGEAIAEFLSAKGIRMVFSEQTFAFEILTTLVAWRHGVESLWPIQVRIPDWRVGFFRGFYHQHLAPLREVNREHRESAASFLRTFEERKPAPEYLAWNAQVPKVRTEWASRLIKHARLKFSDPNDETRFPISNLIRSRVAEIARHRRSARAGFFERPSPAERPYVLVTLHKQPESSIDVLGARFSDQLETIRALARTTPVSHEIWVKEHSNALGDRGPRYYRELRSIPGVRLIDPHASSFDYMMGADLVYSVAGTVCYEAGLLGRRAALSAPMFFAEVLAIPFFNPYSESVSDLLARPVPPRETRLDLLARVIAHSVPGHLNFPRVHPKIMGEENLASLTDGHLKAIAAYPG